MQSKEPIMQVLSAAIERLANQAIDWSNNGADLLLTLAGKVCIIHVQELDRALLFRIIDNKVRVGVDEDDIYAHNPEETSGISLNDNECWLSVSIFAFDKLKQKNQLTKLIKTGQLDFAGDLSILQSLSALFAEIELDVEEVMSKYVGDVAAYQLNNAGKRITDHFRRQIENVKHTLTDAALDEKPIGVRKIMVLNFCDEVKQLDKFAASLEARVSKLEANMENNK